MPRFRSPNQAFRLLTIRNHLHSFPKVGQRSSNHSRSGTSLSSWSTGLTIPRSGSECQQWIPAYEDVLLEVCGMAPNIEKSNSIRSVAIWLRSWSRFQPFNCACWFCLTISMCCMTMAVEGDRQEEAWHNPPSSLQISIVILFCGVRSIVMQACTGVPRGSTHPLASLLSCCDGSEDPTSSTTETFAVISGDHTTSGSLTQSPSLILGEDIEMKSSETPIRINCASIMPLMM